MRTAEMEAPAAGEQAGAGISREDGVIFGDDSALRKRRTSLAAKLALAGFQLHELHDGTFLIGRWDRSVHVAELRGVEAFLARVEGQQ